MFFRLHVDTKRQYSWLLLQVQENLIANGSDLATYVTRFQWDMAKYPIKQSLKSLQEIIAKQVWHKNSQKYKDFRCDCNV